MKSDVQPDVIILFMEGALLLFSHLVVKWDNMEEKWRDSTVVAVLGSTGTGKSKLGIELAQKFNGEIISADSIQVIHLV